MPWTPKSTAGSSCRLGDQQFPNPMFGRAVKAFCRWVADGWYGMGAVSSPSKESVRLSPFGPPLKTIRWTSLVPGPGGDSGLATSNCHPK